MYFSNLLGNDGIGRFPRLGVKGDKAYVFVNNLKELTAVGGIVCDGAEVKVVTGEDEAIKTTFGNVWLTGEKEKEKATAYADTEENPLIWCLTDQVAFYATSKTVFKFIPIDRKRFLFCLISGTCAFGKEGILLSRNVTTVYESELVVYDASKLYATSILTDKETDYKMVYDCVNAVQLSLSQKDSSVKARTLRDCCVVLTDYSINKERELKKEKQRKLKEAKKARIEARRIAEEQALQARKQAEEEADLAKKDFKSVDGLNSDAAIFLQLVSGK